MIHWQTRGRLFWVLQISGWLLFAVVFCLLEGLGSRFTPSLFINHGSAAAAGFLASLFLRFLYQRTRIKDRSLVTLSLIVIAHSVLATNLLIWLAYALRYPFLGMRTLPAHITLMWYLYRFIRWWILLLGWSALYLGFKFWHEWVIQKERTDKALALAQAAHFQMLRYRINPHFLFNALNSIRALIAENKAAAKSLVTELSEYLRYSLVSRNFENVPVRDEIESLQHYFNIQKMRYENKLDVSFVVDPAVEEFPIPSFLIHPLAENAVKHGLSTSSLPLKIQVRFGIQQGNLHVEVSNSGFWIEPKEKKKEGGFSSGLAIVRQRLAAAYPGRHCLEITEAEHGVQVRLIIEKNGNASSTADQVT